jgi:YYY domain-containing protein
MAFQDNRETARLRNRASTLFTDLLLLIVLLAGAYLRLVGDDWGEEQYLHPDERFLLFVVSDISPVQSLGEYFDTSVSTLNPNNRGHTFYVYGTLPIFLARYAVEWVYGHSGFNEVTQVGRPLSAIFDLLTILLVYVVAARLHDRRVGLLAAAFYAAAVLPVQLSHFYKEDTFLNLFTFLAIYFAVRVSREWWASRQEANGRSRSVQRSSSGGLVAEDLAAPGSARTTQAVTGSLDDQMSVEIAVDLVKRVYRVVANPLVYLSVGFGVALGCAMACKLNALPVAFMLPAAVLLRFSELPASEQKRRLVEAFVYLVVAAAVSVLVFRVFQPYAFSGPGFFGVKINPPWLQAIRDQRNLAAGTDFPPNMQWARRPVWFSGKNLVVWGLGLPLGILALVGFLWAGWRMLKGEWRKHVLLWGWVAFYFTWQSLQFNPTMRYQLPIYPTLAVFAGWAVMELWELRSKKFPRPRLFVLQRLASALLGTLVLLATFAYAFAFTRIYTRPITRIEASRWIFQNIPGPINLRLQTSGEIYNQPLPYPYFQTISPGQPFSTAFQTRFDGTLSNLYLPHVGSPEAGSGPVQISLRITGLSNPSQPLGTASFYADPAAGPDERGQSLLVALDQPVALVRGETYDLTIEVLSQNGAIVLQGDTVANEGDWDDPIPYPIDTFNGFGGIYPQEINFNMYWDDNAEKVERFIRLMNQSDYIFITSSRQWGSLPRLPERFPMVTTYYRRLLGCPSERTIEWCYTVAQPGKFHGEMGFELFKVFQSDPTLGSLRINDQFAEEAFTVYDHPKVLIFKKTDSYDPQRTRDILGSVDISHVVRVSPGEATSHPADLMLPESRLGEQRQGGTWSELFNTNAPQNRYHILGVLLWYLCLGLLGLIVYPVIRLAFPGLADRGYPLARTMGLLLLSYLTWVAGSLDITASRLTISLVFLALALLGGILAFLQRSELAQEWRERRLYFLGVEALFLVFFLFDLLIRLGNPDIWHPHFGGERPMDFSYLNAVLKSSTFPPYDPWFAGGYLNYYYYGFVLVGVLIKWLGIVPAFALNLALPTVFSLIALGAFSAAWNIFSAWVASRLAEPASPGLQLVAPISQRATPDAQLGTRLIPLVATSAALAMATLGNLGTVRMILQGYQKLVAPGGVIEGVGFFTRLVWTVQGLVRALGGQSLPYGLGDWYWIPSRVIPPGDNSITEFPFFTVLYSDPHAHLFAIPVALLVLSFAVSVVLSRGRWKNPLGAVLGFLLGALSIGILYPINLSDIYAYLPLGMVALGYTLWRYADASRLKWLASLPDGIRRLLVVTGGIAVLAGLSVLFIRPYTAWYGQSYSAVEGWKGPYTPWSSYLIHWGLFLFVIVTWYIWETRDWLASTPLSSLRKLEPYRELIGVCLLILFIGMFAVQSWAIVNHWTGVSVVWLALPLAAWSGVLLLRPGLPDAKRLAYFMIGTGLLITLMVEVVVVKGDIGRQNTVFKFYLQTWTLFSVGGAVALGWLLVSFSSWHPGWKLAWQVPFIALVVSTAMFTLMGTAAKIKDRMVRDAPHTLDGMAFMQYATYEWLGSVMDLSQDYRAIRWMQENVQGSPVIVEANSGDLYRWYTRFTIYTGLPGVLGWDWHQTQQRALLPPNWISDRRVAIGDFYLTPDYEQARAFLRKYDVRYVVVGQLEIATYPGLGLEKFPLLEGVLWNVAYRDGNTTIYEVIQ